MAYTDKPYRQWLDAAEAELRSLLSGLPEGWDTSAPMRLELTFKVAKPKTSKLLFPKPDIDNFEKAFLDAVTQAEGVWDDDSQVVSLSSTKVFVDDDSTAGIDFAFHPVEIA